MDSRALLLPIIAYAAVGLVLSLFVHLLSFEGVALGGKALQSFSEYKWPGRPSIVVPAPPSDVPAKTRGGAGAGPQPPTKIDPTGGPAKRPKT